jgi:pyruvate kinase
VKPVVVATQMLDSMVTAPAPTRAEASDVATAIYDGADAVMLSAESATGQYPVEAVAMMDRIIRSVEGHGLYRSIVAASDPGEEETPPHAVATATAALAEAVKASAIVTYTRSGTTAARVARRRPAVPILALTPVLASARRLSLMWGAHSLHTDDVDSYEEMTTKAVQSARSEGFAENNDLIVTAAGIPFHATGNTNNIRIIKV